MNIREQIEQREHQNLSPYAKKADESLGREQKIEEDSMRTCFMRDSDRIVHSHVFRREKDKSQVFILPENAHIMNRLTHTLEVTQVAKSIAIALNLNESLTEAIALGHDTAHTCFGHTGESVLNRLSPYGYNHAKAAYRRLNVLCNLNLTKEVLDGIVNHSGVKNTPVAMTLEGQICPFADKIAYLPSDIENAIWVGIIKDIPERFQKSLGRNKSQIMKTLIHALVETSYDKPEIKMDESVFKEFVALRQFCFEEIYKSPTLLEEKHKGEIIVEYFYHYFKKYPWKIPDYTEDMDVEQAVIDYIAGMTDRYAMDLFTKFI